MKAVFINFIINYIISKRDVFFVIHKFSVRAEEPKISTYTV